MNQDLSRPIYSTYIGGTLSDFGAACAVNSKNDIIILGTTESMDFPSTSGSYQPEYKGYGDMFITKFINGNVMYLQEGWNFISIPMIQMDTTIEGVLSPIDGCYDAVQYYDITDMVDPWKHYYKSKPSDTNDLNYLDHIRGFFVHISQPGGVLFEYSGFPFMFPERVPIQPGWNMVGFPSLSQHSRDSGLNNLVFGTDVDAVSCFDAESKTWKEMGPGDGFVPGRGYWVHSNVYAQWDVPL
jgi:hypothetical protein